MARFAVNVLKLVSASVVAQVLGFLLLPIITRLYAPIDFGIFQLVMSITAIVVVVAPFSYQFALMLPKKDSDSINLLVLSLGIALLITLVTAVLLIGGSDLIEERVGVVGFGHYTYFVPILVGFNVIYFILTYWLSRKGRYGVIGLSKVLNNTFSKAVQIGAGLLAASPLGLLGGMIAGFAVADLVMIRGMKEDRHLVADVNREKMKSLASRYRRFPLFNTGSNLTNTLSSEVTPFMLAFFFSPVVTGLYALAHQAVNMPVRLIGISTSQVFFQKASEVQNQTGNVKEFVQTVHTSLIKLGVFPTLLTMLIAEDLFVLVFGSAWLMAGTFTQILAPWFFFVFLSLPLSSIFSVLEKQNIDLSFNLLILVSRVVVLVAGGISGDPVLTILLYSATGVLFSGFMNIWILRLSGISLFTSLSTIARYGALGVVIASPLMAVKVLGSSLIVLLVISVLVTGIYYACIISYDNRLRTTFFDLIGGERKWV
ncbi:O-antigen/teichoic acid export membrane protein [Methanofollis sp. W23]|uniref:oligosaccharide flippase family protein n=1 Tax=Methanofollis sp. W23 TaxID=2817849 RepID=UPI001AE6C292|nr:oligosaccharide flippase family protein [Methanofollis sp. W23]MBP2144602.1 O-antigen/teichoic acid export membrane protein [Methanofollis sp. W23]